MHYTPPGNLPIFRRYRHQRMQHRRPLKILVRNPTQRETIASGILIVLIQLSFARMGWIRGKDPGEQVSLRLRKSFRNGHSALLLALGLLVLSAAVFGWGLQYKLSLYQGKGSISHQIPEAKLLSQKERPAAGQAVTASPAKLPVFGLLPIFLVATIASGVFRAAVRYVRTGSLERSRPPLPPCLQAVFLRPPPVLL